MIRRRSDFDPTASNSFPAEGLRDEAPSPRRGTGARVACTDGFDAGSAPVEVQLALVAYAEDKDDIGGAIESVQGYIAGPATRDQQFAQLSLDGPANQRMIL
jgi:hypothetical protein